MPSLTDGSPATHLLFEQASPKSIAARMRKLRKARGWTLADVEIQSQGRIRAVVIGSYERGDRSMSVERAIEIADLFNIPLAELLCEPSAIGSRAASTPSANSAKSATIVIDLRGAEKAIFEEKETARSFALFLAWIVGLRQDWNGEILSLRRSDLDTLALLMFKNPSEVMIWLKKYHLLIAA